MEWQTEPLGAAYSRALGRSFELPMLNEQTVVCSLNASSNVLAGHFVFTADVARNGRLAEAALLRNAVLAETKLGQVTDSGGGIVMHSPIIVWTMWLSIGQTVIARPMLCR